MRVNLCVGSCSSVCVRVVVGESEGIRACCASFRFRGFRDISVRSCIFVFFR